MIWETILVFAVITVATYFIWKSPNAVNGKN